MISDGLASSAPTIALDESTAVMLKGDGTARVCGYGFAISARYDQARRTETCTDAVSCQ